MASSQNENSVILIVDDDNLSVEIIKHILESEGYDTDTAGDGPEALKKARSGNISLIVLDYVMPEMDGYEVCKELKQKSSTKDIPVIFTSATDDKKSKIKGFELGVLDYFVKPLDKQEFIFKIRNYLTIVQRDKDLKLKLRESRKSIKKLSESESLYRSILDEQTTFIVRHLPDGTRTYVNNTYCKYLNRSAEELLDTNFLSLMTDEIREQVEQGIQSLNPEDPVLKNEFKIPLPDGNFRWHSWTHNALFNSEGKLSEIQSMGRDITEKKISKEAIKIIAKETEGVTGKMFFDSLVNAMCEILNVDFAFIGEYNEQNPGKITTSALSHKAEIIDNFEYDLSGTPCNNVFDKDLCIYSEGIQNQFPEDQLLVDMGIESYAGVPLFGEGKSPLGLLVVLHSKPLDNPDFLKVLMRAFSVRASAELERKRIDEKLQQSELMFRMAFSQAAIGKAMADPSGKFLWINKGIEKIFGYNEKEIYQKTWRDVTHPDYLQETQTHLDRLYKGEIPDIRLEQEILHVEGHVLWVSLNIVLIRDQNGEPLYLIADVIDITERKNNETALQQAADIVDNIQVGIHIYHLENINDDRTLRMVAANPASERLTGVKVIDITGKTLDENFSDLRKKGIPQQYANVVRNQKPFEDVDLYYGDNRVISGAFAVKAFPLPENRVGVSFENITERKLMQDALEESEHRLELALEVSGAGVYDYTYPSRSESYYSQRWAKILGYDLRDLPPRKDFLEWYYSLVHSEDVALLRENYKEFIAGNKTVFDAEYRIRRQNGKLITVQDICHAIRDGEKGQVTRIVGILSDISDRKRAELTLRESEEHYRTLFEQAAIGVVLTDIKTGKYSRANKKFCDIVGYSPKELNDLSSFDITHPDDLMDSKRESLYFAGSKVKEYTTEKRYICKNGSEVWVSLTVSSLYVDGKRLDYDLKLVEDITERKRSEKELRESEERFQSLIAQATDAMFLADFEGNIIDVNDNACSGLGYNRDELLKMKVTDLDAVYQDMEKVDELWNSLKPGKTAIIEASHKRKDGSVFPVEINIASIKLKTGPAILGFARDITQRKEAEKTQQRWENIFNNAGWGIVVGSVNSKELGMMNHTFAKMHGYTIEELQGKPADIVFAPDSRPLIQEYIKTAHERGHYTFESNHIHKDGTIFPVFTDVVVVKDDKGKDLYRIINIQDVTELKIAIDALKESEERFRNIFMTSPDIITISRVNDRTIVDVNDEFTKVVGYNREETIGKTSLELNLWVNPEAQNEFRERLRKHGIINNMELSFRKKNGQIFPTLMSATLIQLNGISHILTVARDIEEMKRYQTSLKDSETKFRLLADYTFDWEYWIAPDNNYIYVSPSCERITGHKASEFMSNPTLLFDIVHPDFVEEVRQHYLDEELTEVDHHSMDFVIIDKAGNQRWITHQCSPVFDDQGNYLGRRGNNREITVRKKAEQELNKLSTAIEQSNSAIVITDTNGIIEYVNPFFEKLTGYSTKEALGSNPSVLQSGKTDPGVFEDLWETISSGKVWEGEFINRKKNGNEFIEHAIITPVKDENNTIINYIAVKQDITEQKHAADALKVSESKFRNIFNNSTDGIMISELDQKVLEVNQALYEKFGYSSRDLGKLYTFDFIEPGDVENLKSRLSILRKSGNPPSWQLNAITKSGKPIPVEISSRIIDYEGRKAVLTIVRDITERREVQRKILNTIIETEEKERSRFAKDLHDGLGPLLSTTKLYVKALSTIDDPKQKEIAITNSQIAIDEAITSIKEIANNISPHILRNFGLVAALNSFVNKINDTNEIILDFNTNLDKRLDENCELSLFRIVIELINNTLKYAKAKKASISLYKRKRLLTINYSDDGIGFDVEKQLSEPGGRGLHNIVNRTKTLNGKIKFNSKEGKGFIVNIEIVPNN